jgi:hypothetical protein
LLCHIERPTCLKCQFQSRANRKGQGPLPPPSTCVRVSSTPISTAKYNYHQIITVRVHSCCSRAPARPSSRVCCHRYLCDQCGYRAKQKSDLAKHVLAMHTNEKPFACTSIVPSPCDAAHIPVCPMHSQPLVTASFMRFQPQCSCHCLPHALTVPPSLHTVFMTTPACHHHNLLSSRDQ